MDFSSDPVGVSCCMCRQLEDSCACSFPLIPARFTWWACLWFGCFKCTVSTPNTCMSNLSRRRCTDSMKKNKPKPVKLMLALRQHFLCHFPLWDRSSHDRYSLELWASLLHMFIKHWCCVLVLYWCTGTLTGARLKREEFSAWKKLSFPIFRNNAGSLPPGLVARGGWLLTRPWVYLQHIFLGQTSCQGMFPGALSLRGAEKTWILSRSPRPEGSTLQLPTLL